MEQLPSYGDQRTLAFCAFCGGETGTRDHCPSRVFLDAPYPDNLPVVPACSACNGSFSEDEEYLACLISCVLAGSTDPDAVPREKIKKILDRKSALRARIEQSRSVPARRPFFTRNTIGYRRWSQSWLKATHCMSFTSPLHVRRTVLSVCRYL